MTIAATQESDYIFFPSEAGELIGDEKQTVSQVLRNGQHGVVAIEPPFSLAKKGHSTALNDQVMRGW